MSSVTADRIQQHLTAHIADQVACRVLGDDDGRVGCVTPLQYPDGDNVVVWVRALIDSRFEVTDYGEALTESVAGRGADRRAIEDFARDAARGQGVTFANGRLTAGSGWDELGDTVWRIATAASQLGQVSSSFRPKQTKTLHPKTRQRRATIDETIDNPSVGEVINLWWTW